MAKFKVGDIVANKKHKTIGIIRMGEERGEVKTDADGNVPISDLEHYSPSKHKGYQIAPSTKKEIQKMQVEQKLRTYVRQQLKRLIEADDKAAYQAHVKKMMAKHGIKSIDGLSDDEKKSFFNKVDASWNSEDEAGKDGAKNEILDILISKLGINESAKMIKQGSNIYVNDSFVQLTKNSIKNAELKYHLRQGTWTGDYFIDFEKGGKVYLKVTSKKIFKGDDEKVYELSDDSNGKHIKLILQQLKSKINKGVNEAKSTTDVLAYKDGGDIYVNIGFMDAVRRAKVFNNVKHLGMGSFTGDVPDGGTVKFDRISAKKIPDYDGRNYKLSDDDNGKSVKKLVSSSKKK